MQTLLKSQKGQTLHSLLQESVVVVTNPDGSSIGILEEDGRLNLESNIEMRK